MDYFVLVMFAFVLLDLLSPVLRQEIGSEERLRNDVFWVGRKTLTQSISNRLLWLATRLLSWWWQASSLLYSAELRPLTSKNYKKLEA